MLSVAVAVVAALHAPRLVTDHLPLVCCLLWIAKIHQAKIGQKLYCPPNINCIEPKWIISIWNIKVLLNVSSFIFKLFVQYRKHKRYHQTTFCRFHRVTGKHDTSYFNTPHTNVLSNELPVIVGVRQLIVATVAKLLGCMHRFVQKAVLEHRSLIVCMWVQLKIRKKSSTHVF